jgi:hypothetical protein
MKNQPAPLRKRNISPVDFDPFNDRLSRDIRNTLSETLSVPVIWLPKSEG